LAGVRWRLYAKGSFLFVKAPHLELYDQVEDPHEVNNVFDKNKPVAARLAVQLEASLKLAGFQCNRKPRENRSVLRNAEKLGALGYVASSVTETASTVDPKTTSRSRTTFTMRT